MGLPIHDAARRAIAHAGHVLAEDIQHAEHDLSNLVHHSRYHQQQATATAVPEAPMSLISTLESDFEEVRAKVEEFAASKLPSALEDVKKLEGNPVADALLSAAHVPASALQGVVEVINTLAEAFPKPDTSTTEPETQPEPTETDPAETPA